MESSNAGREIVINKLRDSIIVWIVTLEVDRRVVSREKYENRKLVESKVDNFRFVGCYAQSKVKSTSNHEQK